MNHHSSRFDLVKHTIHMPGNENAPETKLAWTSQLRKTLQQADNAVEAVQKFIACSVSVVRESIVDALNIRLSARKDDNRSVHLNPDVEWPHALLPTTCR